MPALPLDDAGPVRRGRLPRLPRAHPRSTCRSWRRSSGAIEREIGELSELVDGATRGRARRRGGARVSELLLLGTSHKTAPLALRERVALPEARAEAFLRELADHPEIREAVVLSTCNRTELYVVVSDPVEAETTVLGMLARQAGLRPTELLDGIYSHAQLRRRAPPLPRRERARVDDRRRGRGAGPGQARLRGGARGAHDRAAHQQAVPRRARDRQARAHARPRSAPAAPASPRSPSRPRAARSASWRAATC